MGVDGTYGVKLDEDQVIRRGVEGRDPKRRTELKSKRETGGTLSVYRKVGSWSGITVSKTLIVGSYLTLSHLVLHSGSRTKEWRSGPQVVRGLTEWV